MNSRPAGWCLLALGLLGVGLSALLALGRQGDVSIRDECRGSTVRAYFQPQDEAPPPPGGLSDVNFGKLCNEDAAKRMHWVFALLPLSMAVGLGGVWLVRARPSADRG
jgi:hypothetical protein